jgi:hypothetical protein
MPSRRGDPSRLPALLPLPAAGEGPEKPLAFLLMPDIRPDDTIYDLKNKIKSGLEYDELSGISPNKMEIWKCYGGSAKKLCAYDSFGETKKALDSLKFSDERYSNGRIRTASQVQHLGVAQSVAQLPLEPDELLFVRIA